MGWSAEQLRNAAIIYQVGRRMGLGSRDIQIGLITALVESNLVNVNYGDRDSLGLFQQRPSQGWGTPAQVTDPVYAATKFFEGLQRLGSARFSMPMGDAAQSVQRSAFPSRYAERIDEMRSMWPSVAGAAGEQVMSLDGIPYGTDEEMELQQPSISGMTAPPDAKTMLGAWGMASPQPLPTDFMDGAGTFIGQGTNGLIEGLAGTTGAFGQGVDGWRKAVIEMAKRAVGQPYTWGGTDLSSGVDCSGLTQAAFAAVGIDLPRISYQQANLGQRVGFGGLQPGDLVAWDNSSRNNGADHISLYLGNGYIIEAPRPGLAVRIRQIGEDLEGGWGVHLSF